MTLECNLRVCVKISISYACPGDPGDVSSLRVTRKIRLLLHRDEINVAWAVKPAIILALEVNQLVQILNFSLLFQQGLMIKLKIAIITAFVCW